MPDQEVSKKNSTIEPAVNKADAGPEFDILLNKDGGVDDEGGGQCERITVGSQPATSNPAVDQILRLKGEVGCGGGVAGRRCCEKSLERLARKWDKLACGLPVPQIRSAFIGGVVAEWKRDQVVTLEFSRKLKKAWIDVSSHLGDWGTEVKLQRGGWKNLRKKLRRILLD